MNLDELLLKVLFTDLILLAVTLLMWMSQEDNEVIQGYVRNIVGGLLTFSLGVCMVMVWTTDMSCF